MYSTHYKINIKYIMMNSGGEYLHGVWKHLYPLFAIIMMFCWEENSSADLVLLSLKKKIQSKSHLKSCQIRYCSQWLKIRNNDGTYWSSVYMPRVWSSTKLRPSIRECQPLWLAELDLSSVVPGIEQTVGPRSDRYRQTQHSTDVSGNKMQQNFLFSIQTTISH